MNLDQHAKRFPWCERTDQHTHTDELGQPQRVDDEPAGPILQLGGGKIFYAPPMPPIPDYDPNAEFRAFLNKPLITPEQAETLAKMFGEFRRAAGEALAAIGPVFEQLREAGVLPETPPEDPREKALWLRQHRNTGPARPGPQNRRRTDQ